MSETWMRARAVTLALALSACGPSATLPAGDAGADVADGAVTVDAPGVDASPDVAVVDRAVVDAPTADAPACNGDCGPHGHAHGDSCHCDDGYVERSMCCVPAPPCTAPDDELEENDTAAQATRVRDGMLARSGLRVCPADVDVFRVALTAGQRVEVEATFTHARGDVDVYLYRPGVTDFGHARPAVSSDGTRDNERLTYTAAAGGDHHLVVLGHNGAENAYDLRVTVAGP